MPKLERHDLGAPSAHRETRGAGGSLSSMTRLADFGQLARCQA